MKTFTVSASSCRRINRLISRRPESRTTPFSIPIRRAQCPWPVSVIPGRAHGDRRFDGPSSTDVATLATMDLAPPRKCSSAPDAFDVGVRDRGSPVDRFVIEDPLPAGERRWILRLERLRALAPQSNNTDGRDANLPRPRVAYANISSRACTTCTTSCVPSRRERSPGRGAHTCKTRRNSSAAAPARRCKLRSSRKARQARRRRARSRLEGPKP